ncbi:MAG: hypothetical protein HOY78_29790 [Saccharothrix sp.]|nr:hypothetical protein [Saccharothrix sp.]
MLLIEDPESGATHDEWDPATEHVHHDHGSLYVAVQHAVDGPVTVTAYRHRAPAGEVDGLIEVFAGEVDSPSGTMTAHDPNDSAVLILPAKQGVNRLTVFVDHVDWAARVVVVVGTD